MRKQVVCLLLFLLVMPLVLASQLDLTIPQDYREVKAGEEVVTSIKILNTLNQGRFDVGLHIELLSADGTLIDQSSETVAIETQASFVRVLELPATIEPGTYFVQVTVSSSYEEDYVAKQSFVVYEETKMKMVFVYVLLVLVVVFGGIVLILFNKKQIEQFKMRRRVSKTVKKRLDK